jgi:outer membrane protein assembly factor BamB
VFTIDAGSTVTAFSLADGSEQWQVDLTPDEEDDDLFGGGLGWWRGTLYVTTPFARVFALDEATGAVRWETAVAAPMRVPPAVSDGRVFVMTIDNELVVLAADDGRRLWNHQAVGGPAQLLGGPTPAVLGTVMVAAFSSGELFAFQVETGRILWSDQLAGLAAGGIGDVLTDIHGRPLIDRDLAFAVSYAGSFAGIDLRRGGRAWDVNLASSQTPWVAGDYLYLVTADAELVCVLRRDGRIRWITALPKYEDPEDLSGPILWSGPVLGGDRLLLTNSLGEAYSVSPYSGKILGRFDLPAPTYQAPIIVDGTLLFISDNAELIALR